ncbi:MAG: DUF4961 domain-containing protein [Sphingobacteriaceae bacterium]|nr:MAG: DUF4961 domain-containing protein [Sphingobacteriaceae bacterium]
MRNIKIKGGLLFKTCGVLVIALTLTCCCFQLDILGDHPTTAKVGDEITVKLHYSINTQISGDDAIQTKITNGIIGILAPKGWKIAENATLTYTSTKGNGKMKPMDPNMLDAHNPGYTYSQAMMLRAGRLGNLIDDMEWVPFMTENTISYTNGNDINGDVTIKMKVGADGNDTKTQLGYMFANTLNGIDKATLFINDCPNLYYYAITPAPIILVTGGTTGDLINFTDPQYSYIEPPKALDDDFVTINLTDQTISVKDQTAIVRHKLSAEINDGGKPGNVNIGIMLVWVKEKGVWKLLGRQAYKL